MSTPLTPEETNIRAEINRWLTEDPSRVIANYAIKRFQALYRRNVKELPINFSSPRTFRAIRGLLPLPAFATPKSVTMTALLKEDTVLEAASGAMLRSSLNLATLQGTQQAATLQRSGEQLTVSGFSAARSGAATALYLSVRKRSDTQGLPSLQTVFTAPAARLSAVVSEPVLVSERRAARVWTGAPAEWPLVNGTDARVSRNATNAPFITLVDSDALFTGRVQAGDYVTLSARTQAPLTEPAEVAGVFVVRQVGVESLVLEGTRYMRVSEGVFEASETPAPVSFNTRVDWSVTRVKTSGFFLRDPLQTFSSIRSNDWLHLPAGSWAGSYQVATVLAAGLLELNPVRYTGSGAPYTVAPVVPPEGEEAPPEEEETLSEELKVLYRLTRVQHPQMQTFEVRVTGANLSGVQAADVVELSVRTGALEATEFPTQTPGFFRVLRVTGDRLQLDSRRLSRSGDRFNLTDEYFYRTLTDWATLTVFRTVTTYPYAAQAATEERLYRVLPQQTGDADTLWRLELRPYQGYDATRFLLSAELSTALPVQDFSDTVDVQLLSAFGPALFLTSINGAVVQTGDHIQLQVRAGASRSGAVPNNVENFVLRAASNPTGRSDFVVLDKAYYTGTLEAEGVPCAPYVLASAVYQALTWSVGVGYRVVRTVSPREYKHITLAGSSLDGQLNDVRVGDKVTLEYERFVRGSAESAFRSNSTRAVFHAQYWQIKKVTNTAAAREIELEPMTQTLKAGADTLVKITAPSLEDLNAPEQQVIDTFGAFQVRVNAQVRRRSAETTHVVLLNTELPAHTLGDGFNFITFDYGSNQKGRFRFIENQASPERIVLDPAVVTELSDERFEVSSTTAVTLDIARETNVDNLKRLQLTDDLVAVKRYLTAYEEIYRERGEQSRLRAVDTAVSALFSNNLPQDKQEQLIQTALRQLVDFVPDVEVTYGGFAEGATTNLPAKTVAGTRIIGDLPVFPAARRSATGADWRDNDAFQAALALLADADLSLYLQVRPVQDLKDLYIHARLQVLGYGAQRSFLQTKTATLPAAERAAQEAQAVFYQRSAQAIVDNVKKALTAQQRADVITFVDLRLNQLLPIIREALPVTYPVKVAVTATQNITLSGLQTINGVAVTGGDRVWVSNQLVSAQNGLYVVSSGPWTRDVNLTGYKDVYFVQNTAKDELTAMGTILTLFGTTVVTFLTAIAARDHRQALTQLIAVPPEPSVRRLTFRYARANQSRLYSELRAVDVERHLAQTTNPELRAALERARLRARDSVSIYDSVERLTGQALSDRRQVAPRPLSQPIVAPSNMRSAGVQVSASVDPPPPNNLVVRVSSAVVPAPVGTPQPATEPAAPVQQAVPINASISAVTSYLTGDRGRPDFRRLGIALPYRTLNASAQNESATNFATISLCSDNLSNQHMFQIKLGDEYGELYPNNGKFLYNQFILTGVQEVHSEKFQIVDTLSDGFITFAFGEKPEVWSISGVLINDLVSDQLGKFRQLFHDHLRVSELARTQRKMVINVPAIGYQMFGYAIAFAPQHSSENETVVPFTLQFIKTDVRPIPQFERYIEKDLPMSSFLAKLAEQTTPQLPASAAARQAEAPGRPDTSTAPSPIKAAANSIMDFAEQKAQAALSWIGNAIPTPKLPWA